MNAICEGCGSPASKESGDGYDLCEKCFRATPAATSVRPDLRVDATIFALEEAMHHHLNSPVEGDFMSLTRAWRGILESALDRWLTPIPDETPR